MLYLAPRASNAPISRYRPVKLQRILAQIALAFLLLTQQGGIQHAISHFSESGTGQSQARMEKKQLPSETHCTLCLELAALGTGLHGDGINLPAVAAHRHGISAPAPNTPPTPSIRLFDSRAPPATA